MKATQTLTKSALKLQSDRRLVALTRAGSESAFEVIVERYRRPLLKYCGARLPADRAEDVVQHTFMNAYRALLDGDREMQLKPWLYRIAHNLSINAGKKAGYDYDLLDENYDGVPQPPQVFEQRERIRSLVGHIGRLPPRQRSALVKHELEGRSYREIASEMGASVAAITELLRRARTHLRDGLGLLVPTQTLQSWLATASSHGIDPQRVGELVRGAETSGGLIKVGIATVLVGTVAAGTAVTTSQHGSGKRAADKAQAALQVSSSGAGAASSDSPLLTGRGSTSHVGGANGVTHHRPTHLKGQSKKRTAGTDPQLGGPSTPRDRPNVPTSDRHGGRDSLLPTRQQPGSDDGISDHQGSGSGDHSGDRGGDGGGGDSPGSAGGGDGSDGHAGDAGVGDGDSSGPDGSDDGGALSGGGGGDPPDS